MRDRILVVPKDWFRSIMTSISQTDSNWPGRLTRLFSSRRVELIIAHVLELLESRLIVKAHLGRSADNINTNQVLKQFAEYEAFLEAEAGREYALLMLENVEATRQQKTNQDTYEALYFMIERVVVACARQRLAKDEFEHLIDPMRIELDRLFRTNAYMNVRQGRMYKALPSAQKLPPHAVHAGAAHRLPKDRSPLLSAVLPQPAVALSAAGHGPGFPSGAGKE